MTPFFSGHIIELYQLNPKFVDGDDRLTILGFSETKENCFLCIGSNADRTSWWELVVLASHVHPSVATMARTLLSGAHIVYNGNPLTDLSLAAFLDKFMEKKPKLNRRADGIWHGGSQIAPARKVHLTILQPP